VVRKGAPTEHDKTGAAENVPAGPNRVGAEGREEADEKEEET